jgi:hypothetical protein
MWLNGMAEVMVPPLERPEYMLELRNIAENIARERLEHSEVHPPAQGEPQIDERADVQESCRESSAHLGNAEVSEVEQPDPRTMRVSIDSPSTPEAMPAFVIPMTQEKSLEELPSQLDFDWQDSVSSNPTPAGTGAVVAAASEANPKVMEVDTFVLVSQIAEEAVKNATDDLSQEETCPLSTKTKA